MKTKQMLGLGVALVLPATFLLGCGGDDSAGPTTTAAKASSGQSSDAGTSGSGATDGSDSSSGGMGVDEFCTKTQRFADLVTEAKSSGVDLSHSQEATDLAKELTAESRHLTEKVAADPSLAGEYGKCAKQLADAAMGAGS